MKEQARGFWLGGPSEGETQALKAIEDAAYDRTVTRMNLALEVMNWVVSHQSFGEKIATLNRQQQKTFQRHDKVGSLYLPDYTKIWLK